MNKIFNKIIHETQLKDKILIFIYFLFPFLLFISIFLTDLLASIAGLILIYIFVSEKNFINLIKPIKKELYFLLFFFIIVLLSLLFSDNFNTSFLPSFFYFRYILFALGLYYLFKKYNFISKILLISLLSCFALLVLDAFLQYYTSLNLFNYKLIRQDHMVLTSFFNDEKKLGSFVVRLLPFIISLIFLNKFLKKYNFDLLIIIISGIIIFHTSERTALFLYYIFCFFYCLITPNKKIFILIILIITGLLFINNPSYSKKYIYGTLSQVGITTGQDKNTNYHFIEKKKMKIRYYSEEHENLVYTGLVIFKNNFLFGSGVKTFYSTCNKIKKKQVEQNILQDKEERNYLVCSTHPHSTYIQLLSDVGIFGFIAIFFIFINTLLSNIKIIFYKKHQLNSSINAYYLVNVSIIINLLPFVPSGSFFNNWISFMIFYPIGYWFYLRQKTKEYL